MPESLNPYENTDLWEFRGILLAIDRLKSANLEPAFVVLPNNVFAGVGSAWGIPVRRHDGPEVLVAILATNA